MPLIQDGKIIRTYEEQVQHLTDKHREQEEINKNIQEENSNINDKLDEIDKKIPDINEALNTANEAIQKVTAEEVRAKKAENDLTGKLQVVEGNVTVAGNAASSALTKISEEETRAQNVESILSRQIVQEGVSRGQVYTELQQEIERAKSREDEIDADLSTEILDRTNEDADLRTDIDKNAGDINDIRKLPYIAVSSNKFSDNGLTSYLIPLSDISPISPAPIVGSVIFFQTDTSSYIGVVSELQSSAVSVVAKQKLGGEGGSVTPYTLPIATKSILGGVKSSDKGTDGTDYKVHVNDDGTMVVNVPASGGGGQSSEDDFYVHNISFWTSGQEKNYHLSFSFINKIDSHYETSEDLFNAFFGQTEITFPATGAYRRVDMIFPIVTITVINDGFEIAYIGDETEILSYLTQQYDVNPPIVTDYCYKISISTASSGGSSSYTLPIASTTKLGGVKSTKTGTSGTDYAVEVNSDGTMKVNVPSSTAPTADVTKNNILYSQFHNQQNTDDILSGGMARSSSLMHKIKLYNHIKNMDFTTTTNLTSYEESTPLAIYDLDIEITAFLYGILDVYTTGESIANNIYNNYHTNNNYNNICKLLYFNGFAKQIETHNNAIVRGRIETGGSLASIFGQYGIKIVLEVYEPEKGILKTYYSQYLIHPDYTEGYNNLVELLKNAKILSYEITNVDNFKTD